MDLKTKRAWDLEYRRRGILWRGKNYNLNDILMFLNNDDFILDVGCGNGKTLTPIYDEGYNIIGLDVSIYALKLIKTNTELVQGDILSPPFKDETFDKILMIHILDHFLKNEREKIINLVYKLLKYDGMLFLEVFDINDFRVGKGYPVEEYTYLRGNNIVTHYFENLEILNLLKDFEIIEKKTYEKDRFINKKLYKKNSLLYIAKKN
ncbi:MAG: class I SAM-dependent methyltransferase [Thermoplasmata archaeon]